MGSRLNEVHATFVRLAVFEVVSVNEFQHRVAEEERILTIVESPLDLRRGVYFPHGTPHNCCLCRLDQVGSQMVSSST